MNAIEWTCPKCKAVNQDMREDTVFPMCNDCGESFDWFEIEQADELPAPAESETK